MTRSEIKEWSALGNAEESNAFLKQFWADRDPNPDTSLNEARVLFDQRVGEADTRFSTRRGRGALSDRGRIYILLGDPAQSGTRKNLNFGSGVHWWYYTPEQLTGLADIPGFCVWFEAAGDSWNLKPDSYSVRGTTISSLLERARRARYDPR